MFKIQIFKTKTEWIPAFAGMTKKEKKGERKNEIFSKKVAP